MYQLRCREASKMSWAGERLPMYTIGSGSDRSSFPSRAPTALLWPTSPPGLTPIFHICSRIRGIGRSRKPVALSGASGMHLPLWPPLLTNYVCTKNDLYRANIHVRTERRERRGQHVSGKVFKLLGSRANYNGGNGVRRLQQQLSIELSGTVRPHFSSSTIARGFARHFYSQT